MGFPVGHAAALGRAGPALLCHLQDLLSPLLFVKSRQKAMAGLLRPSGDWGVVLLDCPVTNLLEGCWQFSLFSTTPLFLIIVYNCTCSTCLSSKRGAPQFTLTIRFCLFQVSPTCNKLFPLQKSHGVGGISVWLLRKAHVIRAPSGASVWGHGGAHYWMKCL